jgi:hypothetical protein
MTEFISTYSLNFDNLKTTGSIDTSDWDSLLCENEGCFDADYDLTLDIDGLEVYIDFTVSVDGYVSYDPGDYWTPPCSETEINNIDIEINNVVVDEYDLELTKELKVLFADKLNSLIDV